MRGADAADDQDPPRIAYLIAREVADYNGLLLLPPMTIACSHEHASWAGTVSISAATLHAIISDVITSLKPAGPTGY